MSTYVFTTLVLITVTPECMQSFFLIIPLSKRKDSNWIALRSFIAQCNKLSLQYTHLSPSCVLPIHFSFLSGLIAAPIPCLYMAYFDPCIRNCINHSYSLHFTTFMIYCVTETVSTLQYYLHYGDWHSQNRTRLHSDQSS